MTLDKIRRLGCAALYPTHFGMTSAVDAQLDGLETALVGAVEFVGSMMEEGLDREQMTQRYGERLQERFIGVNLSPELMQAYEFANPMAMSVTGISRYLSKLEGAR